MYIHMTDERNEEVNSKLCSHEETLGQIQLIVGPMFSGKTTELLRRLRRQTFSNRRCILIKHSKDDRYDTETVATHDRITMSAEKCSTLEEMASRVELYDVIGVDEGQFFPDVASFAEEMANKGKLVVVAALDSTFRREGFPSIIQLIPLVESISKLTAVCMMCYRDAAFSRRLGSETELEIVGGSDKYMAVCRKCHTEQSTKSANVVQQVS